MDRARHFDGRFSHCFSSRRLDSIKLAMRCIPITGGVLSFLALILLAVGMATDHWVDFLEGKSSPMNKFVTNNNLVKLNTRSGLSALNQVSSDRTTNIEYNLKHYGLWIGCYQERSNMTTSCAYIGSKCYTDVCWIRQSVDNRQETCKDSKVGPLPNCTAYQFVRAFIIMGIILMVAGTSTQLVSLMTFNRALAAVAGVVVFAAGILVLLGFSIFYGQEYAKKDIEGGKKDNCILLRTSCWMVA